MSSIHYISPFSYTKNLGAAYNEAMRLIPDGDHACFTDYDVLFLTSNTASIIKWYTEQYPHALLTCYTNRINPAAPHQLLGGKINESTDILEHIRIAKNQEKERSASNITRCISGFLMCFSKKIWQKYPFPETGKCLGVDSTWSKVLLKSGIPIYRMNGVYIFHTYRMATSLEDKSHLIPAA